MGLTCETARAKVNLTLHVGRALSPSDAPNYAGYHPVDSLVVFADFGDELTAQPAETTQLDIGGPLGAGLTAGEDNLILQALHLAKAPSTHVQLQKYIPVSAGLGGGSANAAAILRLFDADKTVDDVVLGADVVVCRDSQTSHMTGIGEVLCPVPNLGQVAAVLVNPLCPVSTGEVFRRFDSQERAVTPAPNLAKGTLLARAQAGHNDLQEMAIEIEPKISEILEALEAQPDCDLARMSGSGASCFGLFGTEHAALMAAKKIKKIYPDWWVQKCRLGDGA